MRRKLLVLKVVAISLVAGGTASAGSAIAGGYGGTGLTSATTERWLTSNSSVSQLAGVNSGVTKSLFNTSSSWVMGPAVPGYAAMPVANFKSYATFRTAVDGIPAGDWVLYDNENWSYTPLNEQQRPATYMKAFADLAHQHRRKVIETPARDLMNVSGAACGVTSGQTTDQAYVDCRIPADARYADVYDIQAQADQGSAGTFASLVTASKNQVLRANSGITLIAGLTTDRGDSAATIFNCWKASHTLVAGYLMNTGPSAVDVAAQAMTLIHNAEGLRTDGKEN